MGGNVFKDGSTRRYQADEYHALCKTITPILESISTKFVIIPAYKTKDSFGDMDVLIIPKPNLNKNQLDELFNSDGHVIHNGDVWSLVHKELQIDLITTSAEEFNASLSYFSFNDYGNLRGKIIHKFGMKFGHDGLTFPIKSKDHTLGEVVLSRNPVHINYIFGFDISTKFNTLEDMFESVINSCYFNPAIFAWEEMNAVSRIRDKKRTSYHAFLEYIKDLDPSEFYQFSKDKTEYHSFIFSLFPHAQVEMKALFEKKIIIESVAEKFNGNIVSGLTGLQNKELGEFMKKLRALEFFNIMNLNMKTPEEIIVEIHKNM